MNRRAWIVGAGDFAPALFLPQAGDFVIAADGGLSRLEPLGVTPDLIVGDFDSLGYAPQGARVVRHSPIKDQTDMDLAADEAVKAGCDELLLFSGTGGRLAHTLANLQLLALLEKQGLCAYLIDETTTATALQNGTLLFAAESSGYLSVFAHGAAAKNVTLQGLKYPLQNAELSPDFPLGVSNEFTGRSAAVSVGSGTVIVLFSSQNERPKREKFS